MILFLYKDEYIARFSYLYECTFNLLMEKTHSKSSCKHNGRSAWIEKITEFGQKTNDFSWR